MPLFPVLYKSSTPEYHKGQCAKCLKFVIFDIHDPTLPNITGSGSENLVIGRHNCVSTIINWSLSDDRGCNLVHAGGPHPTVKCVNCTKQFTFGESKTFEKAIEYFSRCFRLQHSNIGKLREYSAPGSCISLASWNHLIGLYQCRGCEHIFNFSGYDDYKGLISSKFLGLCPSYKIIEQHCCQLNKVAFIYNHPDSNGYVTLVYKCNNCKKFKNFAELCVELLTKTAECKPPPPLPPAKPHARVPNANAPPVALQHSPVLPRVPGGIGSNFRNVPRPAPPAENPQPAKKLRMPIDFD